MNNNILQSLNQYLTNPDPQYALMIKGKWGCGKTFFIKKWMKKLEESHKDDKEPKPIYVSLYGLKTTQEITTSINRVLYPRLYGKAAKVGKSLLKIVTGIVLQQNIDLNGDTQSDFTLNLPLDSLSIFSTEDNLVKGEKFLVFDDVERCLVSMKELLGYINYFVEHCHCHVLLIGDETKITGESKKCLDDFKEKTIGKEMELSPDIDSAIDSFIGELGPFVKQHVLEIKKTFQLSECDNLRILRQCLWDFNYMETKLTKEDQSRYEDVMKSMLCCFVATYCEYKGHNKKTLSDWLRLSSTAYNYKDEEFKKIQKLLQSIENKYSNCPSFLYYPIFYLPFVLPIVSYIETGADMSSFAQEQIKPMPQRPSWERMGDACLLSNNEFKKYYAELLNDVCYYKIPNARSLGFVLAGICYYDAKHIISPQKKDIQGIKESLEHIFDDIQTHEALYYKRRQIFEGCNSFITDINLPLWDELLETINSTYEKHIAQTQNSMTIVLENLTDNNCATLIEMDEASLPDHSTTYNSVSIFNSVNIEKVFEGIKSMTNKGRQSFNSFIRKRYMLAYNMGNWTHDTEDDIEPLNKLLELVKAQTQKTEMMERESYDRIARSLQGAINRCNGELKAQ